MSVFNDGDRNDIIREFRKQEYLDRRAEKRCCGNCRWHEQDEQYSEDYICFNDDSDYCSDYTDYNFCCDDYEER